MASSPPSTPFVLQRAHFQKLFDALSESKYRVFGPTVEDSAIIYDEIHKVEDLPIGWRDKQDNGSYTLTKRSDKALFGYVVGPHSWKRLLYPPKRLIWKGQKEGQSFKTEIEPTPKEKLALIGVRPCELNAIAIQDKVFLGGQYTDPSYRIRRRNALLIAINCTEPGGTCFCTSMKTGPRATAHFDLALTEIIEGSDHYFVGEVGTRQGAEFIKSLPHTKANPELIDKARLALEKSAASMGRILDTTDIRELLTGNLLHPQWEAVGERCLTCANCTMVCPTCFCSNIEDTSDLSGTFAQRWRRWDSCFSKEFSYIHGGAIRSSGSSRYRQWLTHKLANWIDQFGASGCVGCGRCITWCPVGIDLTEEVRAIRSTQAPEVLVKKETQSENH